MRAFFIFIFLLLASPAFADTYPPALTQLSHNLATAQSAQATLQAKLAQERSHQSHQLTQAFKLTTMQLQLARWPSNLLLAQSVLSQNPTQPVRLASLLQHQSTQQINQLATRLETLTRLNTQASAQLAQLTDLQTQLATAQKHLGHRQKAALAAAGESAASLAATLTAALQNSNVSLTALPTVASLPLPSPIEEKPVAAPVETPPPAPKLPTPAKTTTLPVAGKTSISYHAGLPGGGLSTGVTFQAAPGSAVGSLTGGTVLYAGPFRSLGGLVIVKNGNMHLIYGGLAALSVSADDPVTPHTTLGTLGATPARLYLEVRHGNTPVDPTPVIAAAK